MAPRPHVGCGQAPAWLRPGLRHNTTRATDLDLLEKESDRPHLTEKTLDLGVALETSPASSRKSGASRFARLSCWAFWSRSSVTHVQGTVSSNAAIQSF